MKFAVKMFFRTVRIAMYPLMLIWEFFTTPKGKIREAAAQQAVDTQSMKLVLYQFKTCPFCIKVRREVRRLSLPIELRDAQHNQVFRAELLQAGGKVQVPCLQIRGENGEVQWMFESGKINDYLHQRFASV